VSPPTPVFPCGPDEAGEILVSQQTPFEVDSIPPIATVRGRDASRPPELNCGIAAAKLSCKRTLLPRTDCPFDLAVVSNSKKLTRPTLCCMGDIVSVPTSPPRNLPKTTQTGNGVTTWERGWPEVRIIPWDGGSSSTTASVDNGVIEKDAFRAKSHA
jgi:hypothetical protein